MVSVAVALINVQVALNTVAFAALVERWTGLF
jgi:hypothetical protein